MYSKQRIFEYRDKPNTLLARMLSTKQEGIRIPQSLITNKGMKVDSVPDKLQVFVEYYQQLYKNAGLGMGKIEEYLNKVPIPKLQEGDKQGLNLSISIQEVKWASSNLKVGKTPGLEGLMAE